MILGENLRNNNFLTNAYIELLQHSREVGELFSRIIINPPCCLAFLYPSTDTELKEYFPSTVVQRKGTPGGAALRTQCGEAVCGCQYSTQCFSESPRKRVPWGSSTPLPRCSSQPMTRPPTGVKGRSPGLKWNNLESHHPSSRPHYGYRDPMEPTLHFSFSLCLILFSPLLTWG